MSPTVSIVMPCYNAEAHLPTSVGSVLAQTRTDWELIIVDDGSTDASWPALQQWAATDARIRVFQQANAGAAAARNHGLKHVQGAYTAFLDSDDTWHPQFLETMLDALQHAPDYGLAYCGWQNIGLGEGRDDPFIPPEYENADKTETLLAGCRWPIHGALVRSPIIQRAGGFDETLSSCMDFDLWLRIGTAHRLLRVPRVLAYYHHHGDGQITQNHARIALNQWRAQQKFLLHHPSVAQALGHARIRKLTTGGLLHRGYACYWERDLQAARTIFRTVMKQRYGSLSDWKYMLPAWLPEHWHHWLILRRDTPRPK